jgi:quercetin dioxygenase-like cupin family protein
MKSLPVVALGLLAFAVTAQESGNTILPSEIQWRPHALTPGLQNADLVGDISKPGPVVYRTKFPPNFMIQPHSHPEDRAHTVISGTWYVGWGTKFDEAKLKALPVGSFYIEPANVVHFVATKGDGAEIQITAIGPIGISRYVDPAHAPKK